MLFRSTQAPRASGLVLDTRKMWQRIVVPYLLFLAFWFLLVDVGPLVLLPSSLDAEQRKLVAIAGDLIFLGVTVGILRQLLRRYGEMFAAWTAAREAEQRTRIRLGALLETMTDAIPDAIAAKDMAGRYVFCNRSAATQLGRHGADILGRTDLELQAPTDMVELRRKTEARVRLGEGCQVYEETQPRAADYPAVHLVTVGPLHDKAGQLQGTFFVARDISRRKHMEESLRAGTERFSRLFHGSPVGLMITCLDTGRILEANDTLARMLGFTREELEAHTAFELGMWADPAVRDVMWAQLARTGRVQNFEAVVCRKDGTPLNILLTGDLMHMLQGDVFQGALIDITEHTRAQRALKAREAQYRALFEHMPLGVVYGRLWPEEGQPADLVLLEANPCMEAVLGMPPHTLLGHPLRDVFPELHRSSPESVARIAAIAQQGEGLDRFQVHLATTARWLDFSVFSVDEGHFIATVADITDRRCYEDDILRINDHLRQQVLEQTRQLQEAVQDTETFIFKVAMRLRAQLQAQADLLEGVLAENLPQRIDLLVGRVKAGLIQDMILLHGAIAYLRASAQPMEPTLVSVTEVVQYLVDKYRQEYPLVHFEVGELPFITAVPAVVQTIFRHLIDNACKFSVHTAEPVVAIGVQRGVGDVTFFVRDNGMGLPLSGAERLFLPYETFHAAGPPSVGVGLALVRRLAQRHGGKTWAQANPDGGATFFVTMGPPPLSLGSDDASTGTREQLTLELVDQGDQRVA